MIPALALLPWSRVVAGLVIVTAVAAGVWKIYYSGKVQGVAETTARYEARYAEATSIAQKAAARLQEKVNQLQEAQNAQTDNDRRRIAALTASLRNRPARPTSVDTTAIPTGQCTGARLYRDDAEFLGWYASEAARVSAALARCEAQYNQAGGQK